MIELVDCAEEHRWTLLEWRTSDQVARYMYDQRTITREEHDSWFSALLERRDRRGWVVTAGGRPVGACFVTEHSPQDRRATFGMYLADPAARGRGAGTAALHLLCERVFSELDLHKLRGEALDFNKPAIATYRRLGFVEEGVLRDQLWREDRWIDVHLLALFDEVWCSRRDVLAGELRERGLIR